jgi:HAD superfamily hydrolase (TIGR01549 family)
VKLRAVPEVVLFDAGNTLVFLDHDELALAAREVAHVVTGTDLRLTEPLAKRSYEAGLASGMSHEDGWNLYIRTIFETAGLSVADALRATVVARRMHDAFNLWRKVPDDLPQALARGKAQGLRYGIVSNSEGKLDELLTRVGLDGYFEVVVDSALEGVRKPDPEIFRRALARMRVSAAVALYAGDIPNVDVDGARAAGLDAVLVDTLGHYPEYTAAPRFASATALLGSLCT